MDVFREWLSDNLRYILLGLAIIVILVIAFFAVRFVTDRLGSGENEKETTEAVSESGTSAETAAEQVTAGAENRLQTENQVILDMVTKYYNAVAAKNIEEVQSLCETLDEAAKQSILVSPIESYKNISIYFKPGMTEGSYLVYPYYEAKLPNIDQLVPSLGNMYLASKEDGSLYVVNPQSSQDVSAFMESSKAETDVQELISRINNEYNTVLSSNTELQAVIKKYQEPETEVDIPDAGSLGVDVNTSVRVTGNLNVRKDSRQDSDQVGVLIPGQTVTRLQVLENGWAKIRFDDGAGTVVEGYVLSEYLEENGAGNE